ncbi:hypothetical protein EYF80_028373 [Liparis tanakae]|uniref:Uncharacterized protein n=1 Tax=Liparis tanakae TaxID=230148 RepID=A0A4Z2H6K2_9TELE|nr:hypothetical protein EYF80_028373 [Liparis tanakae]
MSGGHPTLRLVSSQPVMNRCIISIQHVAEQQSLPSRGEPSSRSQVVPLVKGTAAGGAALCALRRPLLAARRNSSSCSEPRGSAMECLPLVDAAHSAPSEASACVLRVRDESGNNEKDRVKVGEQLCQGTGQSPTLSPEVNPITFTSTAALSLMVLLRFVGMHSSWNDPEMTSRVYTAPRQRPVVPSAPCSLVVEEVSACAPLRCQHVILQNPRTFRQNTGINM